MIRDRVREENGASGGTRNTSRREEPQGGALMPRELPALDRLLPARPLGQRLPVRVVPGFELPAAVVEGVAPCLGRERHDQKPARGGVAGNHQSRDRFEVAARLFLGPELGARRELLQAKGVVALRVTDVAEGVPRLLLQKDRLDPRLEKLVI